MKWRNFFCVRREKHIFAMNSHVESPLDLSYDVGGIWILQACFCRCQNNKTLQQVPRRKAENFASLISHEISTCQKFSAAEIHFHPLRQFNSWRLWLFNLTRSELLSLQLNQFVALAELWEMYAKIADINSALLIPGLDGGKPWVGKHRCGEFYWKRW